MSDDQVQESASKERKGKCGVLSGLRRGQIEGSLWRNTFGRSLGSHDVMEPCGEACSGNGYRKQTTRLPCNLLYKDAMELRYALERFLL